MKADARHRAGYPGGMSTRAAELPYLFASHDSKLEKAVATLKKDHICPIDLGEPAEPIFGYLHDGEPVAWLWGTMAGEGEAHVCTRQGHEGKHLATRLLLRYLVEVASDRSSFRIDPTAAGKAAFESALSRLGFVEGPPNSFSRGSLSPAEFAELRRRAEQIGALVDHLLA